MQSRPQYILGMADRNHNLVTAYQLGRRLRLPAEWLIDEAKAGRLPHIEARGHYLFNFDAVIITLSRRAASEGMEAACA